MTQYTEEVELQQLKFDAEAWAKGVESVHAHSLDSMAYAGSRKDGSVCDTAYNDGSIRREIRATGKVVWFGERLTGQALIDSYSRK